MEGYNIYQDIAQRTGGDIYIGVVGPVRTGKSTFIKKFMDLLVIPNISNAFQRERARDELPQSAAGKTIMTTEPKFIPNQAVEITLSDRANLKVRMIDCVGYLVDAALGHIENDTPRMVKTPWHDREIPFAQAAETGTRKVIADHSTIGLVVTTDGSVTELAREDYIDAEARVIGELQQLGKPFVVLLNTANPLSERAQTVKAEIEARHEVQVLPVNCQQLEAADIHTIMEQVLFEFPITEMAIQIPDWIEGLDNSHWLKSGLYRQIRDAISGISRIRETRPAMEQICTYEHIKAMDISHINLGEGNVLLELSTEDNLFYKILGEASGFEIDGRDTLMSLMTDLASTKRAYDKIANALREVTATGYGIVSPSIEELSLEEPEIVKQGNRFGVRLRASAPSIHMIRADIETEVSPIVGTEKQSEELVQYLLKEFETDPKQIWESNIFGKSLHELVNEGLHNKLCRMPEDARYKLQETLQKIINEGSGGLICIIL